MIRTLAWCGANHVTSSTPMPPRASALGRRFHDDAHRAAEHLLPVHAQVVLSVGDGLRAGRTATPTRGDLEQAGGAAVAPEIPREQTGPVVGRRAEDHGGGAVTEDHARAPVGGIGDARQRLRTDHQHVVEVAGGQHRRADDELVDEARAPGVEVERAATHTEAVAHERAGVGDGLLGGRGGDDEEVDGVGSEPGVLDRRRAGLGGQARGGSHRRRRCGARRCRCARRSTGRSCRRAARGRRW